MADFLSKSDNDLDDKLNQLKNSVNKCSPNAIKVTKKIINHHANTAITASELFADTIIHQEGIEGLDSFFSETKAKLGKRINYISNYSKIQSNIKT